MQYDKYTIKTTTAAEDIIAASLYELGIEGVQIENSVPLTDEEIGDMFIDFPPELGEDDGLSSVIFYLESDMDAEQKLMLLQSVNQMLSDLKGSCDIGEGTVLSEKTDDVDWLNKWKAYFKSFSIGDIFIYPGWEEAPKPGQYRSVIEIDPGISFGTGKHETTYMCIELLQKYVKEGMKLLDAGCGSGILSIAGLKLSAAYALGLDIDENCITSSYENTDRNGISRSSCEFLRLNLLDEEDFNKACTLAPEGGFDIIVANILADVIIPMLPRFKELLKSGAPLILSGIIDFKENDVVKALKNNNFEIQEIKHMGEWVAIACTSFS